MILSSMFHLIQLNSRGIRFSTTEANEVLWGLLNVAKIVLTLV